MYRRFGEDPSRRRSSTIFNLRLPGVIAMLLTRLHKLSARLKLHNYRYRLAFAALLLLSVGGLLVSNHQDKYDVRLCFMDHMPPAQTVSSLDILTAGATGPQDASTDSGSSSDTKRLSDSPLRLEDVLLSPVKPTPGRSIFFHETSCGQLSAQQRSAVNDVLGPMVGQAAPSAPRPNLVQLTARQACAIESAALHNANSSVFVLFASPAYLGNISAEPLLEAILAYRNVHLRNLNLWTYAAGTPMYEWLKDGELFKSRYVLSHISDFLRYLTLYRWGGTYLDMDIVALRSLEELPPNYTGAESNTHLAAGVMNFAAEGFGHEVATMCLHDFRRNFNGDDWGNNGPGVITRVMATVCRTRRIELMLESKRCMGFRIFGRDAFYAIPWVEWQSFFDEDQRERTLQRTHDSYVIHLWNKHSKRRRLKVGEPAAYGVLAAQHCPRVYAAAGEYF